MKLLSLSSKLALTLCFVVLGWECTCHFSSSVSCLPIRLHQQRTLEGDKKVKMTKDWTCSFQTPSSSCQSHPSMGPFSQQQ